ncbi:MAG: hypothetical protein WBL92_10035 [Methanothrix sp.]
MAVLEIRIHISPLKEVIHQEITMTQEDTEILTARNAKIEILIAEQRSKMKTLFTANSELQTALANLPELSGWAQIDVGSKEMISGDIILSKEFGVLVEFNNGRYCLIPKEAIRSVHFAPKNVEIDALFQEQDTD